MRNPETAQRLDEAMKDININAKELSDRSGVPQSSISQYLSGIFAPRNQTAKKLADALGVNPMWLMNFENEPKHRPEEHFDYYVKGEGDMIDLIEASQPKGQKLQHLFEYLKLLNPDGVQKLNERAEELIEIPKYRKDGD